jgi:hypothetical protein
MSNVLVNVYNPVTLEFVAGAVTDNDGRAALLLDGVADPGTTYEARFYRPGVLFQGPKNIAVIEPLDVGQTNKFDVSGADAFNLPLSNSSYTCRCTGLFVDIRGLPIRNAMVRFSAKSDLQSPKVWNASMVASDSLEIRTDDNGMVSVDLLRTGEYDVTFYGESDLIWCIKIPNTCSVNLIDLIHPYPVALDWDDSVAAGDLLTVAVGEKKEVPFRLTFADFTFHKTDLKKWITLLNSDPAVMQLEVDYSSGKAYVTGLAEGTANVELEQVENVPPLRFPVYPILDPGLAVTVTP